MPPRLGEVIKHGRQARRWTLRHLADQITKEDGTPISPQYLFDIEVHHRAPAPHVLRELGLGFCNIDQPQVSYSIGYLRLHGRNAAAWFAEDANRDRRYDYRYTDEEPKELVETVGILSRRTQETYVITNNHFRGQAALNALELQYHLRRGPVQVPPPLLQTYPELRRLVTPLPEEARPP